MLSLSLSASASACLPFGFHLSVPGSGIIAVEINPPMQFFLFVSENIRLASETWNSQTGVSVVFDHAEYPLTSLGLI